MIAFLACTVKLQIGLCLFLELQEKDVPALKVH